MKINQIKAGATLSYVIIAVNNIVGLVYTPFMLRMLGQNEYGLYSLVAPIISYLTVLDVGFNNAVIRYTARYRVEKTKEDQFELFGMFLFLYVIVGLIALLLGGVLFFNIDNLFTRTMTPDDLYRIKVMMAIMIANVAFTFPMSIWGGIITAYEDFVFQKTINLARVLLNPLVMVFLLLHGYKAIGMVVVTTVFNVLTLSINAIYCFRKLKIRIRFKSLQIPLVKEVIYYSFWIFLCAVVDRLYWGSGQFVLGLFRSASEIAIFAVAIQIQAFFTGFSYAISNVLLPRIVQLVTSGSSMEIVSNYFIRISRIQFYPIGLILFGFILFGKQFVIYWAGPDYEPAYYMALCFMIPQLFTTMQQTGYSILQALNKVSFRSLAILASSLLAVIVSIPVSRHYGGLGVSICISLGLIIGNLLVLDLYYHKRIGLDMNLFWMETLKLSIWPIVISGLSYIILVVAPPKTILLFLVYILAYSILYLFGCFLFSFSEDEKVLFLGPIKRIIGR